MTPSQEYSIADKLTTKKTVNDLEMLQTQG